MFYSPKKAYTNRTLIHLAMSLEYLETWVSLRKQCPLVPLMTTLPSKFAFVGSHSKGYPVARNGREVSILALGAGICCKVIFLYLEWLSHPHFPLGASCILSVHWAEKWFQWAGLCFSLACFQRGQNAFFPTDGEHWRLLADRFYGC